MRSATSRLNTTISPVKKLLQLLCGCFLLSTVSVASESVPFDCTNNDCDLLGDGPFEQLVVGSVVKVATNAEAEAVFHWAREHGYWAALPDDAARFAKTIQMMSIKVGTKEKQKIVTLLMGREHYDAVKIAAGDFIRYTPHDTSGSAPKFEDPADTAYWNLFGCIAVLCRADDTSCPSRYVSGAFSRANGKQLDLDKMTPIADGILIDTGTYMPLPAKTK